MCSFDMASTDVITSGCAQSARTRFWPSFRYVQARHLCTSQDDAVDCRLLPAIARLQMRSAFVTAMTARPPPSHTLPHGLRLGLTVALLWTAGPLLYL